MTDGKAGMVNQALGLAEALARGGGEYLIVEKTIVPAWPWSLLPAGFWPGGVSGAGLGSSSMTPSWPDVIVSCGRHAIGPAVWVKRQSAGKTSLVHAQHPRTAARHFDVIVAQSHDGMSGANVVTVLGSMHCLSEGRLASASAAFADQFAGLPRPTIGVLIGGSNKTYRMTAAIARGLASNLRDLAAETGCGLLVTASRRTGAENLALLRDQLAGPDIYFWDEQGENPYFAILAHADAFLVTGDSVNMISEACFTGKPVEVIAMEGGEGSKFERFHREMQQAGYTRPFTGELPSWTGQRLDETSRAAAEIIGRLARRQSGDGSPQGI